MPFGASGLAQAAQSLDCRFSLSPQPTDSLLFSVMTSAIPQHSRSFAGLFWSATHTDSPFLCFLPSGPLSLFHDDLYVPFPELRLPSPLQFSSWRTSAHPSKSHLTVTLSAIVPLTPRQGEIPRGTSSSQWSPSEQ